MHQRLSALNLTCRIRVCKGPCGPQAGKMPRGSPQRYRWVNSAILRRVTTASSGCTTAADRSP